MEDKNVCPCIKIKCIRHGKCEECRTYHKDKKRSEYCMRKVKTNKNS